MLRLIILLEVHRNVYFIKCIRFGIGYFNVDGWYVVLVYENVVTSLSTIFQSGCDM